MAISTIYEVNKPTYKFYTLEKAGYTDMAELVTDLVTDMTKDGKFSIESIQLTDENNFIVSTPTWPPEERLIEIAQAGVGYRIGNMFDVPMALAPNIKVTVANVNAYTGAVTEITVDSPGNYSAPAVSNVAASFSTTWLPINTAPI